jgi:uncharacterized membrane protein
LQQRSSLAHRAYLVAISIKGLDGAIELVLGGIVAILGAQRFSALLMAWSAPEIAGTPEGDAMRFIRHSANGLAHASTIFVIVYLLAHGVIKLGIAVNLLRGKSWMYPVASVLLAGFIAFMSYRLSLHFSGWLFAFALFDAVTLALVINEWRSPRTA